MKAINTKSDYENALTRIEELIGLNPKQGTAAFDELNTLGTSVSAYEAIHFPIDELS